MRQNPVSYKASSSCRQLGEFGQAEPDKQEETQMEPVEIRPEIMEFAQEMELVMRKHDTEKGDSWKNIHVDYLKLKLQEEYGEASVDTNKDPLEYVDLANVSMMIYHRYKHKINLDQKID